MLHCLWYGKSQTVFYVLLLKRRWGDGKITSSKAWRVLQKFAFQSDRINFNYISLHTKLNIGAEHYDVFPKFCLHLIWVTQKKGQKDWIQTARGNIAMSIWTTWHRTTGKGCKNCVCNSPLLKENLRSLWKGMGVAPHAWASGHGCHLFWVQWQDAGVRKVRFSSSKMKMLHQVASQEPSKNDPLFSKAV